MRRSWRNSNHQFNMDHCRRRLAGNGQWTYAQWRWIHYHRDRPPETILGDTGVCVHPMTRATHLRGMFAVIPMVNRPVPFIFDDYIDMEFGRGR